MNLNLKCLRGNRARFPGIRPVVFSSLRYYTTENDEYDSVAVDVVVFVFSQHHNTRKSHQTKKKTVNISTVGMNEGQEAAVPSFASPHITTVQSAHVLDDGFARKSSADD